MHNFWRANGFMLAVGLAAIPVFSAGPNGGSGKQVVREDRLVAGGPKDFLEVRHLVLAGTNEEIGRALAAIGKERHGLGPQPSADPFRTRVQRRYIDKTYPILHERMRGVAAAFGKPFEDDAWQFDGLWYLMGQKFGCSVVYYPPGVMADGKGVFSRNYDFTTGTISGAAPKHGELPCTARPYVVEMYPDRGYASLAVYSYDLLSGALDGINSEGLTVALLADDELVEKFGLDPSGEGAVGLGVVQMIRMLLDTCATVREAKEALLTTKQHCEVVPVHYLVADRHGEAFIWEFSRSRNKEYIFESPGKRLITTNFSLHRHLSGKELPNASLPREVCPRYCALAERIAAQKGKLTADFVKDAHRGVDMTRPGKNTPPTRTLWHALYRPDQRSVEISFYLRDEIDPKLSGKSRIVRSDYLEFVLKGARGIKE
jgi:hypothetical protein